MTVYEFTQLNDAVQYKIYDLNTNEEYNLEDVYYDDYEVESFDVEDEFTICINVLGD